MKKYKRQFGGKVTDALISRYSKSAHWQSGKFENLEVTTMDIDFHSLPKLLYKQFFEAKNRMPKMDIPVKPLDASLFLNDDTHATMVWYGHSVLLLRIGQKTLLIDPMFGPDAAPIAPFPSKRFSPGSLEIIDTLPPIDIVLLTHDHYDHLDYDSIMRLKEKTKHYYTALGVGRHLARWGIADEKITEFDWWDQKTDDGITITFTPSRHFSGRGLTDRAKCLWGGWVFKTAQESIYFSGDGGYGEHFSEVGRRLGPFDFGLMECGQYNKQWHQIHMYPEESISAAQDAGVAVAMPVHWGAFTLAQHSWDDPVKRFVTAAESNSLPIHVPAPGVIFDKSDRLNERWWENMG